MLVVDANIIVHLKCRSAHTDYALQAYARDQYWLVPPLWRYEFLNALACFCHRGIYTSREAAVILSDALAGFGPQERAVNHGAALTLAAQHRISGCDAQYIALAQELAVRLLTEDKELLRKFPTATVSLRAFCNGSHTTAGRP
jgi:predicted nucleic acid-binding protein